MTARSEDRGVQVEARTLSGVSCPVADCPNRIHAGGLCNAHYLRLVRQGDVMADIPVRPRGLPIAERLLADSVRTPSGCREWRGPRKSNGYGNFKIGRKQFVVHRVAYEQWIGPIPDGLEIDHLCRNRSCIEPSHLEAVTSSENHRRIPSVTKGPSVDCPDCGKRLGVNSLPKHLGRFHTEEADR